MAETETLVFKVLIRGRIEDVWREITKTDEPQGCFFNNQLHTPGLKPGAPIRMRSKNGRFTAVVGEVLEFDPPRRYAHTLRFTAYDDPPCKVSYDLKQVEGGVEFTLTCTGVPKGTRTAKQMQPGGKMILSTLKRIVETGRPPFGMRMIFVISRLMEPFSPKRLRTENWPM